jgi:hypothetical protein
VQISVKRGGFGPMEGGIALLGIAAGVLGVIEPLFRPIAAGTILVGAVTAIVLVWRRRRETHPSISRHANPEAAACERIEPK